MNYDPKPLTMEQFDNNTPREWASGAYQLEIRATIEDNERLRALIKQVEAHAVSGEDSEQTTGVCPWCGAWRANVGVASVPPQHHLDTCPAFTPDGQVR